MSGKYSFLEKDFLLDSGTICKEKTLPENSWIMLGPSSRNILYEVILGKKKVLKLKK